MLKPDSRRALYVAQPIFAGKCFFAPASPLFGDPGEIEVACGGGARILPISRRGVEQSGSSSGS